MPSDHPSDYVMFVLASMDDPGVVVFLDGDYSDHPEEMQRVAGPVISVGSTDSILLRPLGVRAYGFFPIAVTEDHADLMHGPDELPLVALDTPMPEVLIAITRRGFGVAGVTDAAGRLVGVITDGDLRRHMDGLLGHAAAAVMTRAPRTIAPDALAEAAVAVMNERKITCLFVVDPDGDGRAEGILHIHDCLRAGVV